MTNAMTEPFIDQRTGRLDVGSRTARIRILDPLPPVAIDYRVSMAELVHTGHHVLNTWAVWTGGYRLLERYSTNSRTAIASAESWALEHHAIWWDSHFPVRAGQLTHTPDPRVETMAGYARYREEQGLEVCRQWHESWGDWTLIRRVSDSQPLELVRIRHRRVLVEKFDLTDETITPYTHVDDLLEKATTGREITDDPATW